MLPLYIISALTKFFSRQFIVSLLESRSDSKRHEKVVSTASGNIALYIHIPYCLTPLCKFCCFVRYPLESAAELRAYYRALHKELNWYYSRLENADITSVYFGGGTPTVDVYLLSEIIDVIKSYFGKIPITVEANPRTLNDDTINILRSAQIERFSVGIQSFQEWKLKELGRFVDDISREEKIILTCLKYFNTVNIDLVWGTKRDTQQSVLFDAWKAFSLGPHQVTFYPILPYPSKRKAMPEYASSSLLREFRLYRTILYTAKLFGYEPRTPWLMGKQIYVEKMIDEYITEYEDFLGIGVSSIGKVNRYVYINTFSPAKYVKMVKNRGVSIVKSIELGDWQRHFFDIQSTLFGLSKPIVFNKKFSLRKILLSNLTQLATCLASPSIQMKDNIALLYMLHLIQKELYTNINILRDIGMRAGI